MNWKEIAKFAAGVTAWETIVHLSLAARGVFPITLFGFTITQTVNTVQIIVPAIISISLAYYAWGKK